MAYEKVGWKDYPNKSTPMNSKNLEHMDGGIFANATAIGNAEKIAQIGDGTLSGAVAEHEKDIEQLNTDLQNENKHSGIATLALNQEMTMAYDGFGTFAASFGASVYSGYTLYINDVPRIADASISGGMSLQVTRSFSFRKGDTVMLSVNDGTAITSNELYFK